MPSEYPLIIAGRLHGLDRDERRAALIQTKRELIMSMSAATQTTQEILDISRAISWIQEQIAA